MPIRLEAYKAGPLEVVFTMRATNIIGILKTIRSRLLKKISNDLFTTYSSYTGQQFSLNLHQQLTVAASLTHFQLYLYLLVMTL